MIEVIFVVCMIERPLQCRDVYLNFEAENVTPHQCMSYGQQEMAKWIMDHPGFRITKWRCGRAGQMQGI